VFLRIGIDLKRVGGGWERGKGGVWRGGGGGMDDIDDGSGGTYGYVY